MPPLMSSPVSKLYNSEPLKFSMCKIPSSLPAIISRFPSRVMSARVGGALKRLPEIKGKPVLMFPS